MVKVTGFMLLYLSHKPGKLGVSTWVALLWTPLNISTAETGLLPSGSYTSQLLTDFVWNSAGLSFPHNHTSTRAFPSDTCIEKAYVDLFLVNPPSGHSIRQNRMGIFSDTIPWSLCTYIVVVVCGLCKAKAQGGEPRFTRLIGFEMHLRIGYRMKERSQICPLCNTLIVYCVLISFSTVMYNCKFLVPLLVKNLANCCPQGSNALWLACQRLEAVILTPGGPHGCQSTVTTQFI